MFALTVLIPIQCLRVSYQLGNTLLHDTLNRLEFLCLLDIAHDRFKTDSCLFEERLTTRHTEGRSRCVDRKAVMALSQGHGITIGFLPADDPLLFEDLVVGIGIAEVDIGLEHRGVDVTPHHFLDDHL